MQTTAYPLSWPATWPRYAAHKRLDAPFFTQKRVTVGPPEARRSYVTQGQHSTEESCREIHHELGLLGGQRPIISTNLELRQDGLPYSNRRAPEDPGAAVWFTLAGKPSVLAVDKWKRVEDNLWAIAKHIEALRGQNRWGVGTREQAFAGYTALPAPGESGAPTWWAVLGVAHDAPLEVTRAAYREQAKRCHPDQNAGEGAAMVRLNAAWDQAKKAYNVT